MEITHQNKTLSLDSPVVMGILNVTPDSFSDGGLFQQQSKAVERARQMLADGATIIDIGGESTRPGAADVAEQDEINRVVPVIKAIRERSDCWISIDTSKAAVMRAAVEAGANLINDVRALREPGALTAAADLQVPVCIMHMQGQPRTMQAAPDYTDVIQDVIQFLNQRIDACLDAGVIRQNIILDPGYGFGKTLAHNYQLLAQLDHFHHFGLPILAGMSRKSMIYKALDKTPHDVLGGSIACATLAAVKGAQIIRVHDVKETADALKVVALTMQENEAPGE
ncbi:dihydropteroate synthase [Salinivibrio sp. MA427]|jgi:dihydropteroate synthase|uniref:Dihydropteroate synthase n=2 Tax=Salinivibrio TaxID=51366 RepID=A0ABX3KRE0_SALCS|nr:MULTISPECIES: dihydropteroate synthase [Salinivibrio]NUY56732.1 dihydropteroate synthase [Salinivibrio sp. EAGSL]OOE90052.1 dihydropteroate synthase [Salinivibrio sp. AR647]OOF04539.1 dihydropteroate synthase [Salinivibrio sp. MA607]OOF15778.1 dihydropteroate synthase [Salinivibrio sp. MA427]OOF34290.1 dihydropteroate synthase [Salinivibrio costicola subsp. alcaliphilus]